MPTSLLVPTLHNNIWNTEKEKLAQKAVAFYREKIEKEQEIKNMITGNMRIPNENSQESAKEINYMVEKRRAEIEKVLDKGDLSDAAKLKLKI